MKGGKMIVWGGFKKSLEKKRSKKQRTKEKIYPDPCRVPETNNGEIRKP